MDSSDILIDSSGIRPLCCETGKVEIRLNSSSGLWNIINSRKKYENTPTGLDPGIFYHVPIGNYCPWCGRVLPHIEVKISEDKPLFMVPNNGIPEFLVISGNTVIDMTKDLDQALMSYKNVSDPTIAVRVQPLYLDSSFED